METFLDDYEAGKAEARYVNGSLPVLPFADDASFLCWRWEAGGRRMSMWLPPTLVPWGTKRSSKPVRTSFGGAGTR